jgi:hypothetical protein
VGRRPTIPTALTRARARVAALATYMMLVGLMLVMPDLPARAEDSAIERAVKATYLYKFGPFIEWPRTAFDSPFSPVYLCIVGNDPFEDILDRAVRGQRIGDRPIVVRRLRTVDRDSGCHIMYAAGSDAQSVAEILDTVRGTPVLTITDAARDAKARGIIHFVVHDNRVRFIIDDYAASKNGITISSKVLSLALSVRPRA